MVDNMDVETKLDTSLDALISKNKGPGRGAGRGARRERPPREPKAVAPSSGQKRGRDQGGAANGRAEETITVARRIYVHNLSFRTSWQDLKDHFRAAGNVVFADVMMERGPNGMRSKGWGIVEFESPNDAGRAIVEMDRSELHGREVYVREDREDRDLIGHGGGGSGPKRGRGEGGGRFNSSYGGGGGHGGGSHGGHSAVVVGRRVFVTGIPAGTGWQELKDWAKQAGRVAHADIVREATDRRMGNGVVEFESAEDALRAISRLSNSELNGATVMVREYREEGPGSSAPHRGGSVGRSPPPRRFAQGSAGPPSRTGMRSPRPAPTRGGYGRYDQHDDRVGDGGMNGGGRVGPPASGNGTTIVVHGLPYSYAWQELKDLAAGTGVAPTRADIVEGRDGRSKGWGLVSFATPGDARRAIQALHGTEVQGRVVTAKFDERS